MTDTVEPAMDLGRMRNAAAEYDPLDVLPSSAREKLEAMQDKANALHAGVVRHTGLKNDAQAAYFKADQRLRKLVEDNRGRSESDEIVQQREAVDRLRAKRDRAQRAYERSTEEWHALNAPANDVAEYVRKRLGRVTVKSAARFEVFPNKGETIGDAIARTRDEIASLTAEIARIGSAPYPSAETKAAAERMVDALADIGRPNVAPSVRDGESPRWPMTLTEGFDGRRPADALRQFDAPALLAWLFRDRLVEALHAEIDALSDDTRAVPPAERLARIAEIKAKILEASRREEALIEQAEASGVAISRRRDADPRAVLGLAASMPEPASA